MESRVMFEDRYGSRMVHPGWAKWRRVADRIVANRHYKYGDPSMPLLLSLWRFAFDEMSHYNNLMHRA